MVDQPAAYTALKPDVVILGGGVAGIATAMYLLEQNYPVTLVEARQFLGGRAFSFPNPETGALVDNGQHVIVGCCTYFRDFLQRLGALDQWYLQPRLRLRILDRLGREGVLAASLLPAPFHLLPAFLVYPHLRATDKMRVLATLARAKFTNRHQPYLEHISFYQWLKQQGQSERAMRNLWNLLVMPTLNDDIRDVSASMGLMIIQDGMLEDYRNANVGYALNSLIPSLGEPSRKYLAQQGCRLLLGSSIKRIIFDYGRVKGIELASGETVSGQVFVSALPATNLLKILPVEMVEEWGFFGQLAHLETSPIINIHLWYDRPVMDGDFCAFVDSPVQWVFNKSAIHSENTYASSHPLDGPHIPDILPLFRDDREAPMDDSLPPAGGKNPPNGQYICISVSAAWEYIDLSREELAKKFIEEMALAFPIAKGAKVKSSLVVKQRHATFRCLPGANDIRPGSKTPIPNLFLAGEWTHTGWPSTMESAVRSGYNAAQAIFGREGI